MKVTDRELDAMGAIYKRCSYEQLLNGKPIGCGDLLEKYGKNCNYSIMSNEQTVTDTGNILIVYWEAQSVPIDPARDMLKEALSSVLEKGTRVHLQICDRSKFFKISYEFTV